jgi:hypothetical protein
LDCAASKAPSSFSKTEGNDALTTFLSQDGHPVAQTNRVLSKFRSPDLRQCFTISYLGRGHSSSYVARIRMVIARKDTNKKAIFRGLRKIAWESRTSETV